MRVLQITDTHLFATPSGEFDGVNTLQSLTAVIDAAAARCGAPDLIVCTGDLVHEETRDAYELLRGVLRRARAPVCCIPGNHDDPELMASVLRSGNIYLPRTAISGRWRFHFLDTRVAGEAGGHLEETELVRLEQGLAAADGRFAAIFLHHHPVVIGSPWMDAMMLDNAGRLFAVIDRFEHVRCVAWGHIHQAFAAERNGVVLLGAPSTCVQFAPQASGYRKDAAQAGYRWFDFNPDGSFETGVERLAGNAPGGVRGS